MLPSLCRLPAAAAWLLLIAPVSISATPASGGGLSQAPPDVLSPFCTEGAGASSSVCEPRTNAPAAEFRVGEKLVRTLPGTAFSASFKVTYRTFERGYRRPLVALGRAIKAEAASLPEGRNLPRYSHWPKPKYDILLEVDRAAPDCSEPRIDRGLLDGLGKMLEALGGENIPMMVGQHLEVGLVGTIAATDSSDPPAIKFRLFPVDSRVGASEKLPNVEFGNEDLQVVRQVKREIMALTTERDLLLFLGNGAAYYYYAFKPEDGRNVHLVPLSGQCMHPAYTDRRPVAFFKAAYLDPAFSARSYERVILIDHALSGMSVAEFTKLLSSVGLVREPPYFINLAYPRHIYPGGVPRYEKMIRGKVKVLKEVIIGTGRETLLRFDQAEFGRVLPSYPRSLWHYKLQDVPNADRAVGETIVRQIKADRIGA
ncbi:MAG: hypothetical protein M1832_002765 [Thelocarpon impressellum]|nr:MAG: hypothetical protein M1832_002765 [Thelocarpon impressellum]